MKILFVGLGNPEEKYLLTRHNAGRRWVEFWGDRLQGKWQKREKLFSVVLESNETIFSYPLLYMNESGRAVKKLLDWYHLPPTQLCLVHDELDLPLGSWKLSFGKGSPLHKGVASVEENLGGGSFWRLRLGIDNRPSNQRMPGIKYVLQKFSPREDDIFSKLVHTLAPTEIIKVMTSKANKS